MSDFIGIVMGGYLDENDNLMERSELNKRIGLKNERIKNLESHLAAEKEKVGRLRDIVYALAKDNQELRKALKETEG